MTRAAGRRLSAAALAGWTLALVLTLTVPALGPVVAVVCLLVALGAFLHREVHHAR